MGSYPIPSGFGLQFVTLHIYIYMQAIFEYGVAKVLDSRHPEFKAGDLVWGITGWEEYSLITKTTATLIKIQHTESVC